MKKNLFFLFALICSMSLFTACSDDDDDKIKDPVIGTWKVPAVELDENNSVIGGSVFMTWEAPEDTYLSFLHHFLSEKYRFVSPRHSLFYQYLHQLLFRDSLSDV